jgi:hypothetical protein
MGINVALAALNVLLALVLATVYVRNYRQVKSPFTLGLLLFALFLVVHDGTAVYYFLTMMPFYSGLETVMLVENLLQAGALAALVSATLR